MKKRAIIPGPVVCELHFAPAQAPQVIALVLVDTLAQLRAAVEEWSGKPCEEEPLACCCYDHSSKGDGRGFLIFARERLTRRLVVHECTHAGQLFVASEVMGSEAVQAMKLTDQDGYYEEALATTVEELFAQAEKALFPAAPLTSAP